jgi:hypothetical protein
LIKNVIVLVLVAWPFAATAPKFSVSCPLRVRTTAGFKLVAFACTDPKAAPVFTMLALYVTFHMVSVTGDWLTNLKFVTDKFPVCANIIEFDRRETASIAAAEHTYFIVCLINC